MGNVGAWAEKLYSNKAFVSVMGKVKLAQKALKPVCIAEEKPKKAKQQAAAPKPKKEEKPKGNPLDLLPPTNFDLYNFKTFFVNHPDKKGVAVDEWYKMLDWDGWSFWYLQYIKYEAAEGAEVYRMNNLGGGFMQRIDHFKKYAFARHAIVGDEPELELEGVWFFRGQEVPQEMKDHPQFEYHKVRKLDPRNVSEDDKLVREFFGGAVDKPINGMMCQTIYWHK